MNFLIVSLLVLLLSAGNIMLSAAESPAQKKATPAKELLQQLPPYANKSVGVIDFTAFDPESVLLKEILSFTGLDELMKDLDVSPADIAFIAFGSEIQTIGQADYFAVRFRGMDAEKYLNGLMSLRGARKDGGRIFFGHGRKYAEMLAPDEVYVVHASKEMRHLPRSRTLKKNKLIRALFQDRPTLVMYYSWDIEEKNDVSDRESTCKTALFTIDLPDKKNQVYHMETLYNCIDFQLVSDELRKNMRRELIRNDMENVIRRLKVKVDTKKNKIMFFTKIGTWEAGEFEGLLDSLNINGRVRRSAKSRDKKLAVPEKK